MQYGVLGELAAGEAQLPEFLDPIHHAEMGRRTDPARPRRAYHLRNAVGSRGNVAGVQAATEQGGFDDWTVHRYTSPAAMSLWETLDRTDGENLNPAVSERIRRVAGQRRQFAVREAVVAARRTRAVVDADEAERRDEAAAAQVAAARMRRDAEAEGFIDRALPTPKRRKPGPEPEPEPEIEGGAWSHVEPDINMTDMHVEA